MARQIIDLRTEDQKQGITGLQRSSEVIADILQTLGKGEKIRRERQQLDRIANAIAGGATTTEAILAAANQPTEFDTGIRGFLQRAGGRFAQPGGGVQQDLQQVIIGDALRKALTPEAVPKPFTLGPGEERFTGKGERIAGLPAKPKKKVIFKPTDLKNIRESVQAGVDSLKETRISGNNAISQDNLLRAYKEKANEFGYSDLSKAQQKQFDAIWDKKARRKSKRFDTATDNKTGTTIKLGWNPKSPEVKQARRELRAGTQQTGTEQTQNETLDDLTKLSDEELQKIAAGR